MKVTLETLAAIYRMSKHLMHIDGEVKDEEIKPVFDFFQSFDGIDSSVLRQIVDYGTNGLDDTRAIVLIKGLDDEAKQKIADLFASIVCADNELTEEEKTLYRNISDLCVLPDPSSCDDDEDEDEDDEDEDDEDEDDEDDEEEIIPAFLVANFYGKVSVHQSEHEDWSTLGDELASWIGADRVEVVRYTKALNALSERLDLNERHLVFMVARNGYDHTVGDNMTATILYGGGYPIYGNIVFALETDNSYEIEGIRTQSLLNEVFQYVNEAVDGLLSVE